MPPHDSGHGPRLGKLRAPLFDLDLEARFIAPISLQVIRMVSSSILPSPRMINDTDAAPPALRSGEGIKLVYSVTVNRPPWDLYEYWRKLQNLPQIIGELQSVEETGGGISHWKMKSAKGSFYEWDAKIIEDKPGEMMAWETMPGSDIDIAGSVRFVEAPGQRGSYVKVALKYDVRGGKLGAAIAKMTGDDPRRHLAETLIRFKALMETGEMPTVMGQTQANEH